MVSKKSSNSQFLFGKRKKGGQHGDVFTSPLVVRYMLDKLGYTSDSNLSSVRILEPSCGEGEFLEEIVKRLKASSRIFGFDALEAFKRNVRAFDIDAQKIAKCRTRVANLGMGCADNIQIADFLKAEVEETDIVVGNPPYIRYENIPEEMLNFCKKTFSTFHYRCDLYVPFFEKSLAALSVKGKHCFICSNRWLKNEYGKKLRLLIAKEYNLQIILNLEGADAFQEDVAAYPAITFISKEQPSETFCYADCQNVKNLETVTTYNRTMPKDEDWSGAFNSLSNNPSLQTIEEQGFKIGIGVATGADAIFISREFPGKIEKELIMPGVNAKDLKDNRFHWQGEYLLNPYNADGTLVDLADYPLASAYLERHKEKLVSRHVAKKTPSRWYKTIDRISPTLLSQPKILLPDMSGNTFIFVDDGEFYPLHNIYYIVGRSSIQLRLLAAFLMSDFVRNQLASVTNKMNGGFSRWQSQHLRKLKLPVLSSISEDDVQELLFHYERRDISNLNKRVNRYV